MDNRVFIFRKLAIGTVQFGLDYGINNDTGMTPDREVNKILAYCLDKGINVLDTAHLYGESEKVLGRFNKIEKFRIITKTPHFKNEVLTESDASLLEETYNTSIKRLKRIPDGLLIHNGNDLLRCGGERLYEKMLAMKNDERVSAIGVSLYSPEQCEKLIERYEFDLVQLPMSVYDQRFLLSGMIDRLFSRNVEIHVRSAFLQGLLLMDKLPRHFRSIFHIHKNFIAYCKSIGKTPLQVATMFIIGNDKVSKLVAGVNNKRQLIEIAENSVFSTDQSKLRSFSIDDESIINPSKW
jgi:aryl-alcohol dehydrogenase-like predicted oxidoreductase